MDIFEKIYDKINEYESKYNDLSIERLLYASSWFAIYACRLSEVVADLTKNYNQSYFLRKLTTEQTTQGFVNDKKYSMAKANSESLVECAELLRTELADKGNAYKAELLLKQINILNQTIQQRVSYLKQEQQQTNKQV